MPFQIFDVFVKFLLNSMAVPLWVGVYVCVCSVVTVAGSAGAATTGPVTMRSLLLENAEGTKVKHI